MWSRGNRQPLGLTSLLPVSRASQHALSLGAESRLLYLLFIMSQKPSQPMGLVSPPWWTPGLDAQSVIQHTHSSWQMSTCVISLFLLSPFPVVQVLIHLLSFSSYPITCVSFLQSFLYRSSASFQLVFSKNCSICRCIFDVFSGGGELHILFLHQLDPLLRKATFNHWQSLWMVT